MTATAISPDRRVRLSWAFVPVALLVSSAVGVGSMAYVAVRDPHFAIESDYYQKAIQWDQSQAQAGENRRLGYRLALPSRVQLDEHGRAQLELSLIDRRGQPVLGARVSAEAFANAYSGVSHGLTFSEQPPGTYRATLAPPHSGLWIFRVRAQLGGDTVTADLRADLGRGGQQ